MAHFIVKDEVAEPVCTSETCSYYGKGICETPCKEEEISHIEIQGETDNPI